MVGVGVSTAFFKMPSFKRYSSLHSTFWMNVFSLLLSFVIAIFYLGIDNLAPISWTGILWGICFAVTTALQKILLHRMETTTLLPVTSALSNVVTVFLGILLFSERVSLVQYFGICIILCLVFIYSRKKEELILDTHSITLGLGIIISSTLGKVIQKFGATHELMFHYAPYQYLGAVVCSLLLVYTFERKSIIHLHIIKDTWKISLAAGLFMTIAGYAFLKALATGPLSGVYPIASGYIFITAILGVFLYKEKMTAQKVLFMMVCVVGIILIKIG